MGRSAPDKRTGTVFTFSRRGATEIKNVLPGIHVRPYVLDREKGVWVLYLRFEPKTALPRYLHTAPTHFYTTAGSWISDARPNETHYAGAYIYAAAGSIHAFKSGLGAEGFIVGEGALISVNEDDTPRFIMDAGWIEDQIKAIALRDGQPDPHYLKYQSAALSLENFL